MPRGAFRAIVFVILAAAVASCSGGEKGAAAGTAEALAGTVWRTDTLILAFHEPPRVQVAGKAVPVPGGTAGAFEVNEGAIVIHALGTTRTGTWDGTNLVIEGVAATRER